MATTLLPSTATLNYQLEVTIDGRVYSIDTVFSLQEATHIDDRVEFIPTSGVQLATITESGAEAAQGFFNGATPDPGMIVFVNKDATNSCRLRYARTSDQTVDLLLEPGDIHILTSKKFSANETGGDFSAYVDMQKITLTSVAGTSKIQMIILTSQ